MTTRLPSRRFVAPIVALAAVALLAIGCERSGMAAPAQGEVPAEAAEPVTRSFAEHSVAPPTPRAPAATAYEIVAVAAGMRLDAELNVALASTDNRVDDRVRAVVRSAVTITGRIVIPRGSELRGEVIDVAPSGNVQGRARLAFRFYELFAGDEEYAIRTAPLVYRASGTRREDVKTIALGAGAGALIGAIAGGKKGAAVGSAIGGGAGTAVVLSTPGEDVRLMPGAALTIELLDTVEIRLFDDEGR